MGYPGFRDPYASARARIRRQRIVMLGLGGLLLIGLVLVLLFLWPAPARNWLFAFSSTATPTSTAAATRLPSATPPTTPTVLAAAVALATPLPTPPIGQPAPTVEVLYAFEQTTAYTFTADDPPAKASKLLTALGVPPAEQQIGTGLTALPLTVSLPALARINDLAGAVYDPAMARLVLVGKYNPALPELEPADLLVALRAVYSGRDDVGVSIDPIDPAVLDGPMQVNYFGDTQHTHFGRVMYEADRHLKVLSSGQDNLTHQPAQVNVPGYHSELVRMFELSPDEQRDPQWHRMWYLVKDSVVPLRVSADGNAMLFDEVPLMIEARFVAFDQQGQKHDVPGHDPVVDAFVKHFNTHFAEFAAEKAEVAQLGQLAKLLSIARWLYANQIAVDFTWLNTYAVDNFDTPATTPGQMVESTQTVTEGNRVITRSAQIFGGVDFQFGVLPRTAESTDPVQLLQQVANRIPLDQAQIASIQIDGEQFQAAALALSPIALHNNFILVRPLLSLPTDDQLALEVDLTYDSFDRASSVLGPGWRVESHWLEFPSHQDTFQVDDTQVPLYATVTMVNRKTGQRQRYRNSQLIDADGLILYQREAGEGPAELYYDYHTGHYTVQDEASRYTFTPDGRLQAQTRGGERIEIQRDETGNPLIIQHSNGSAIRFIYTGGRLTQVDGPDGSSSKLIYTDGNLTMIKRPQGKIEVAYQQDHLGAITEGERLVLTEYDRLGRLVYWESQGIVRSFVYNDETGESVETIEGIPGHSITVDRDRLGHELRLIDTVETRTTDRSVVRTALADIPFEPDSLLAQLLENSQLDLTGLGAGRINQIIVTAKAGGRVARVEGNALVIDGRLALTQLQQTWERSLAWLNELDSQGYQSLTFDPESGVVAGFRLQNAEARALIPQQDGARVVYDFPDFQVQPADLARFVTTLGAQRQLPMRLMALFPTRNGQWLTFTPAGEQRIVLSSPESLAILTSIDETSDRAESRTLAKQLSNAIGDYLASIFTEERTIDSSLSFEQLIYDAYPITQQLFKEGLPPELIDQFKANIQPGAQAVQLKPLQSPHGWLLPGPGPFFLSLPPDSALAFALARHLLANNIRLIAPESTVLYAQAYLAKEQMIPIKRIAVIFTPHSKATPAEAEAQRRAFAPIKQQLEALGARVEDVGDDPTAHERLLAELANQDLVVFDIAHSGIDARMSIYNDGSVELAQVQRARGAKYFMSCCSVRTGWTETVINAGANAALGVLEPISTEEVNTFLAQMADYLASHSEGVLPSQMEQAIRLELLRQKGGLEQTPAIMPMSIDPDLPASRPV